MQAMPLYTLSEAEWDLLISHLENIDDLHLLQLLDKIRLNQARLEIISEYIDYYADLIDQPVKEKSVPISA